MAKVIAVTNQKGGVGKTTTCSALCGGLVKLGKRVLAIDLDPQGNLSFSLGADTEESFTIHDVFKGVLDIEDAIQETKTCDVIPSNILLSASELELTSVGREYILREQLEQVSDLYDYIVVDTPPALSILTINAYTASDMLVIPMMAEILSLQGISQLKETVFAVKKYYNQQLEIKGILLTKYNPRLTLTKEVEELTSIIAKQLKTKLFDSKITSSVVIAEAPAHGITIMDYAPKSKATKEYMNFIEELLCERTEEKKDSVKTKKPRNKKIESEDE